jgi:hypothetical protein
MSWYEAWALRRDLKKLRSKDKTLRSNAALRLGAKGDKRALEELIRLLNDSPVRTSAAVLLAAMRDESAIRPLSHALIVMAQSADSLHNSLADRLRVAEALKSFGPAAVEPLAAGLRYSNTADGWKFVLKQLASLGPVAIPHLLDLLKDQTLSRSDVRTEIEALGPVVTGPLSEALPLLDLEHQDWSFTLLTRFGWSATKPEHLRIQKELPVLRSIEEVFRDVGSGRSGGAESASCALCKLGAAALEPLWNRFVSNAKELSIAGQDAGEGHQFARRAKHSSETMVVGVHHFRAAGIARDAIQLILESCRSAVEQPFLEKVAGLKPPEYTLIRLKAVSDTFSDNGIYVYHYYEPEPKVCMFDVSKLVSAAKTELACRKLLLLPSSARDYDLLERIVHLRDDTRIAQMLLEGYSTAPETSWQSGVPDNGSKESYLGLLVDLNSIDSLPLLSEEYYLLRARALLIGHKQASQPAAGSLYLDHANDMSFLKFVHAGLRKLLEADPTRFGTEVLTRLQSFESMVRTPPATHPAIRVVTAGLGEVDFGDVREMARKELARRELASRSAPQPPAEVRDETQLAGPAKTPEESSDQFYWP